MLCIKLKGCADDTTFYSDTIKIKPAPKINSIIASEINSCTTPTTIDFTGTPSTTLNISIPMVLQKTTFSNLDSVWNKCKSCSNSFTTGLYDIRLTVTDTTTLCSKDSIIQTFINIGNNPAPSFTASVKKLCSRYKNYSFTGSGAIASYAWTFPGAIPQTGYTASVSGVKYNSNGVFSAKLVVTFTNGCIDSVIVPNYIL
jgi:hypothetical protein